MFLALTPHKFHELQLQDRDLSTCLFQAHQLRQMRSTGKEDSKANARVVEIFASYRNVGYLDTDVGQPEFGPPEFLSLTVVDEVFSDLTIPTNEDAREIWENGARNLEKEFLVVTSSINSNNNNSSRKQQSLHCDILQNEKNNLDKENPGGDELRSS